ncbi:MAG: precorrin-8X methylmutase, partial [Cyanobacteriota bacterium]|nr:precorrin-8X methylmutase [Cyanobacteriota bacterium]
QALARTDIPQIRIEGRKGGSSVAAAILNALLVLAWQSIYGE